MDDVFKDVMPVNLIEGRMPESRLEIILPQHLDTNGGVKHSIGDVLFDIEVGFLTVLSLIRYWIFKWGKWWNRRNRRIRNKRAADFHGGGFYERPSFELYVGPGYTALTLSDNTGADNYDVYIKVKKLKIFIIFRYQFS